MQRTNLMNDRMNKSMNSIQARSNDKDSEWSHTHSNSSQMIPRATEEDAKEFNALSSSLPTNNSSDNHIVYNSPHIRSISELSVLRKQSLQAQNKSSSSINLKNVVKGWGKRNILSPTSRKYKKKFEMSIHTSISSSDDEKNEESIQSSLSKSSNETTVYHETHQNDEDDSQEEHLGQHESHYQDQEQDRQGVQLKKDIGASTPLKQYTKLIEPSSPTGSHSSHSLASPENLLKLKTYINTLRSQYSTLSKYFLRQQEDLNLMKKEMSFMENLLERRMNRIRELELEKRIDRNDLIASNNNDQSHEGDSKNLERMKVMDEILNRLYLEKRDKRILFIEEDEEISRENLIVNLKLENQRLKEHNKKLEEENIEWAKQIRIKQQEIDELKINLDSDHAISDKFQKLNRIQSIKRSDLNGRSENLEDVNEFDVIANDSSSIRSNKEAITDQSTNHNSQELSDSEGDTITMSDSTDLSEEEEIANIT